ncbi:alkaline phosphatase family protein [Tsukamurella tyrosinosolvens]|uniref:Predicted pyrophosphatase or phosphodiesterase, AlkP superfamily n=1 Tax=Tsukamurella tyrosinosolvens TaxID=57704 RepID=A0A1H4QWV7_TSUTY|nr:alkaline phosphatase family protein [Tsukamurella tyrosinosolvens]AUN39990.1 alkaline phosphatase family protein [Tsukamurella tyrosinosolvens]KXO91468.1 phosphodiesterase [Tsukamurella tyrosinosolvens]SEC24028.1 Predicted pyrophosphatase or phosphodiesterase, AlkP superfamily [Tsukamurella tyrosinosolvens]
MTGMLSDVLPSVCSAFGIAGENPLGLTVERDVVLLLIDGLGAELLRRHAEDAPTLAAHVRSTLNAGFPATTASSLSSLALGAPCAAHGIVGYSFGVPDEHGRRLFNSLRWTIDGASGPDARESHPPRELQRRRSRLEDLADAGAEIHYVVPAYQETSGLTRASFRAAGVLHPASHLDEVRAGVLEVARHDSATRRFAYAYTGLLDAAGHVHGPGSPEWLGVLRAVDAMFADLLADLPATCTVLATGDHGMIQAESLVNLDVLPALHRGVRIIAGEARVRHVYLARGHHVDDVLARWSETLGPHAHVVTREQALDEHWFGPTPPNPVVAHRIGHVLAVAQGGSVLVTPSQEPMESRMLGHHGAWTVDEQAIPLITAR